MPTGEGSFETGKKGIVQGPKPISTSSPAGLAAAQMVTPSKLSALLLERGPLAIRHITQTLGAEIPSFKDLSSSKQRRLIMSAMESGDVDSSVVFEKIGWGQWSAKVVEAENFAKERELTNAANAKVKDIVAQESQRRRSSSSHNRGKKQPLASLAAGKNGDGGVVYIDENPLASEDEDEPFGREEEDGNEDEDDDLVKSDDPYSFRRRKSSVVFADSSPEGVEHELLAQRVRPLLKGKRGGRRSSSKMANSSVFKPGVHLDHPNGGSSNSAAVSLSATPTMIDLEQISNSLSESSSRRESRVSFSKESSIRSTLLPHKNYHWIPTSSPRLTYQTSTQAPPLLAASQGSNRKRQHSAKPSHKTDRHSDTDEEDWAAMGAATLRNNSVPPKMDTVATSPNGFVAPKVIDTSEIPGFEHQLPPPAVRTGRDDQQQQSQPRAGQSEDSSDAAKLLMSLKS
ncbi:hypothetical protein HG536_0C00930 [Torulaspora globosa]|uniref:Uncharacterized protein n=1 Tax=Torulaspora globosa TaxID=48254 RepID=A0A7G3ZEJ0_9SACH|nr:uncharacterized protein HG536_0C00930 [Torulaspora globosa]QLL31926.1 hypothetical protein HG536_0C00930 [Torulaspora globosa]